MDNRLSIINVFIYIHKQMLDKVLKLIIIKTVNLTAFLRLRPGDGSFYLDEKNICFY